jgi:hypothetical protein
MLGQMAMQTSRGRQRALRRFLRVLGRILGAAMIGGATFGAPKLLPEAPAPQTIALVDEAP